MSYDLKSRWAESTRVPRAQLSVVAFLLFASQFKLDQTTPASDRESEDDDVCQGAMYSYADRC